MCLAGLAGQFPVVCPSCNESGVVSRGWVGETRLPVYYCACMAEWVVAPPQLELTAAKYETARVSLSLLDLFDADAP